MKKILNKILLAGASLGFILPIASLGVCSNINKDNLINSNLNSNTINEYIAIPTQNMIITNNVLIGIVGDLTAFNTLNIDGKIISKVNLPTETYKQLKNFPNIVNLTFSNEFDITSGGVDEYLIDNTCIRSVDFRNAIGTVNPEDFANCYKIEKIILTNCDVFLAKDAFNGASNLQELHLDGFKNNISSFAFANSGLKDIDFSSYEGEEIGWCSFLNNKISSLNFHNLSVNIGKGAFAQSNNLTSLDLSGFKGKLDTGSFYHCPLLEISNVNVNNIGTENGYTVYQDKKSKLITKKQHSENRESDIVVGGIFFGEYSYKKFVDLGYKFVFDGSFAESSSFPSCSQIDYIDLSGLENDMNRNVNIGNDTFSGTRISTFSWDVPYDLEKSQNDVIISTTFSMSNYLKSIILKNNICIQYGAFTGLWNLTDLTLDNLSCVRLYAFKSEKPFKLDKLNLLNFNPKSAQKDMFYSSTGINEVKNIYFDATSKPSNSGTWDKFLSNVSNTGTIHLKTDHWTKEGDIKTFFKDVVGLPNIDSWNFVVDM